MGIFTKAQADKAIRSRRGIVERIASVPNSIVEQIGRYGNSNEGSMCRALAALTAGHDKPLARGNREKAARNMWPADKWPTLYVNFAPGMEDVRRSLVIDGRLPGGMDVSWLAYRHLKAEVVDGAWTVATEHGSKAALLAGVATAAVVLGCTFCFGGSLEDQFGPYPAWSPDWMPRIMYVGQVGLDTAIRASVGLTLAGLSILFLAPSFSTFAFLRHIRGWLARAAGPLQTPTRDALAIYRNRSAERADEYHRYTEQVAKAARAVADWTVSVKKAAKEAAEAAGEVFNEAAFVPKAAPTIALGRARGRWRAAGRTFAPSRGDIVALDNETLRTHTLILGETGSGKTYLCILPILRRILEADWGSHKVGAYVADGKGTLWRNFLKLAAVQKRQIEHPEDIVVVGTEPGMVGMDLLKNRTPLQIASLFLAVCEQTSGEARDKFWQQQASFLVTSCATIASVLKMDTADLDTTPLPGFGQDCGLDGSPEWATVSANWLNGGYVPTTKKAEWCDCTPMSIMGIALLAADSKVQSDALTRVLDLQNMLEVLNTSEHAPAEIGMPDDLVNVLKTTDVKNAIKFLDGEWKRLASQTSSSIVANVNQAFGALKSAGRLRDMFANGKPPQVEKLDEEGNVIRDAGGYAETEPMPETSVLHALNGGFLLNAIGAENGPAAQIISVIIKTNLYIEGKARLVRDPDACARTSCATVIDECQLIMTTGPDSDADTWNTARETGLFLIAATQNYAALESRLGDKGTSNIVNLLCTKIFLKSQDVEKTHPLAIKLGGTALGGLVAYEGLYATQADREMEVPDVYPGVGFGGFSLEAVMPTSPAVGVGGMKDAVGFDNRFVLEHRTLSDGGPGQPAQTNRDAVLGSQGQAAHRQEDQNRTALTGGVTRQNVLSSEDLMGGGGLAFVVAQRAGESVIDIIDLRSLVVEAEAKDKREEKEREAAAQKLAA